MVLVLDASTPAVTAALVRVEPVGAALLAQRRHIGARAHGERLAPAIQAILTETQTTPGDLGAIVAGVGPGPFTGLRVGLVTAAAMGQALSVPTYGVCSLDAIGAQTTGTALVATDARRKEVYWAVYHHGKRVTEPAVGRPEEVGLIMAERGLTPTAAWGEGAWVYANALGLEPREPRYPPPEALAELAAQRIRTAAPSETLTPLYLRRPDAVERKPIPTPTPVAP